MLFGKEVFIDEQSVYAVLQSLNVNLTKDSEIESLSHLFLVDQKVLSTIYPNSKRQRLFILQDLIVEIIIDCLSHRRLLYNLKLEDDSAFSSIMQDAIQGSDQLLCWSILYWLYVRAELDIKIEDIASQISLTPRTIRRYREQAVKLLTRELWNHERRAREDLRRKTILTKINFPGSLNYIQHHYEVKEVVHKVTNSQTINIYLHGEHGVGKTTFIKQCIIALFDQTTINDVIWLNNGTTTDEILDGIRYQYNLGKISDIHILFNTVRIIVVLEDLPFFKKSNKADIQSLLEKLSGSVIFIENQQFHSTIGRMSYTLELPALTQAQSQRFIQSQYSSIPESVIVDISLKSKGIPMQLVEAVNAYKFQKFKNNQNPLSLLSFDERQLLVMIPTHENNYLILEDFYLLQQFFGIDDVSIEQLFKQKLITIYDNMVGCNINTEDINNTIGISQLLDDFTNKLDLLREPWKIITHVLLAFSNEIDANIREKLLRQYWRKCVYHSDRIQWHDILSSQKDINVNLIDLAKASMFKHLNNLELSINIFKRLIIGAGRVGDFSIQSEAMIELIKINRTLGNFGEAFNQLSHVNNTFKQYLTSNANYVLILEHAQLLIKINETDLALTMLQNINGVEASLLRAEIHLLKHEYNKTIQLCLNLLDGYLDIQHKITAHNLLGRCYRFFDINLALQHCSISIEYSNMVADFIFLGRSLINLSVVLIANEDIDGAIEKLQYAEKVCSIANDITALETIKRNKLRIQQILISRY